MTWTVHMVPVHWIGERSLIGGAPTDWHVFAEYTCPFTGAPGVERVPPGRNYFRDEESALREVTRLRKVVA